MRKSGYTILTITLSTMLLLQRCKCESNTLGPPSHQHSRSINESKENDVFQFEVVADRSVLILDSGYKFEIKNAWVENEWTGQARLIGNPIFSKYDSAYQLLLNLTVDRPLLQRTSGYFYFIGNRHLDTFIHFQLSFLNSKRLDTLKVPFYREPSRFLPRGKDRIAYDTLTFVKRLVSE